MTAPNVRWLGGAFVLLSLVAVVACRPARQAPEQTFQQLVLEVLREQYPQRAFVASPSDPMLIMSGGNSLYLQNLRARVERLHSEAERRATIAEHFARVLVSLEKDLDRPVAWEAAKPHIRPRLVAGPFKAGPEAKIVRRPFAGDLEIAYVVDQPDRMMFVLEDMRAGWNVAVDTLHATAIENLERAIAGEAIEVEPGQGHSPAGHAATIAHEDGYAAARLTVPSFRRLLQVALGDPFYVAVPSRDRLIAWSVDYSDGGNIRRRLENRKIELPYPITRDLFEVAAGSVRRATLHP